MFLIPCDYWTGRYTLDLGVPWLTPEAIAYLEGFTKKHHTVLEFGCGGSTIYFAQKCTSILTFDNNPDWIELTKKTVLQNKLTNVTFGGGLCNAEWFKEIPDKKYDIVVVDSNTPRDELCKHVVNFVQTSGILVLDNYAGTKTDQYFPDETWGVVAYDDLHWSGSGTKIYHKIK